MADRKIKIDAEAYKFIPWARTVIRLTPNINQLKALIRWYKSKKAKELWGTEKARYFRQAIKYVMSEKELAV